MAARSDSLQWMDDFVNAAYTSKNYIKTTRIFQTPRVVYNMYNDGFNNNWDQRFAEKLKFDGFDESVTKDFEEPSFENVSRALVKYVDGLSVGSEDLSAEQRSYF